MSRTWLHFAVTSILANIGYFLSFFIAHALHVKPMKLHGAVATVSKPLVGALFVSEFLGNPVATAIVLFTVSLILCSWNFLLGFLFSIPPRISILKHHGKVRLRFKSCPMDRHDVVIGYFASLLFLVQVCYAGVLVGSSISEMSIFPFPMLEIIGVLACVWCRYGVGLPLGFSLMYFSSIGETTFICHLFNHRIVPLDIYVHL